MPKPGQSEAEIAALEAQAATEIALEGQAALQQARAGVVKVGNLRTRRGILSTLQSVAQAKAAGDVSSKGAEAWSRLLGRALQALDMRLQEREETLAELEATLTPQKRRGEPQTSANDPVKVRLVGGA